MKIISRYVEYIGDIKVEHDVHVAGPHTISSKSRIRERGSIF